MRTNTLCNPLLIDNTAVRGTFGMMIKSREFVGFDGYRMGFNGKEFDAEISGDGNNLDFGARVYDSRLGRFLSIDPFVREFSHYSPYQYAGNKPIQYIDLDGAEESKPKSPANPSEINTYFIVFNVENVQYFYDKQNKSVSFMFDTEGSSSSAAYWWDNNDSWALTDDAELFDSEHISGSFNDQRAEEITGISVSIEKPMMTMEDSDKFIKAKDKTSAGPEGKMFRHISAQAYLTVKYGKDGAKAFGDFYERNKGINEDSNFDLINNERGRQMAGELETKYDFSTPEGVAGFLNEIVNVAREEHGLEKLEGKNQIFDASQQQVKDLVIKKQD